MLFNVSIYRTTEKYTLGTADPSLVTNVSIKNSGEASYLTQLFITIPPGFEYGGIEKYSTKQSITCSPSDPNNNKKDEPYDFVCDIGNPLPANEQVDFGVRLTGTNVDTSKENVEVKLKVNSTNDEEPGKESDNTFTVSVPLEIKAQLALIGRSSPEQVNYDIRNRTEGNEATFDFEVGPVVSHLYQVLNRGPSAVKRATLDIIWPSFSDSGSHLLYLIDTPFVSDPSKAICKLKQGQNVNPESLTISNEHIPTPSTEPIDTELDDDSDGGDDEEFEEGDEEEEVFETTDDRLEEDDDEFKRKKRDAKKQRKARQSSGLTKRRKQQKEALKQVRKLVADAGHTIEYRGKLNPAEIVSFTV